MSEPEVDTKALEESLKEQEKANLEKMDEKTTEEGEKKYAGGPIPRTEKK